MVEADGGESELTMRSRTTTTDKDVRLTIVSSDHSS